MKIMLSAQRFHKMQNKNGMSSIVSTVLIITITIAAVAVLINALIPFVKDRLAKSSECLAYKEYFQFKDIIDNVRYNCNLNNGFHGASIKAEDIDDMFENNITGFNLVFSDDKSSETIIARTGQIYTGKDDKKIWMLGSTENLKIPVNGTIRTYVYNAGAGKKYKYASIYPVMKSGKICGESGKIKLNSCNDGVLS